MQEIGRGDGTNNGGGELLPGRLAAGGLAGGLLRTRHRDLELLRIWVVVELETEGEGLDRGFVGIYRRLVRARGGSQLTSRRRFRI
jgi:hypothetical protein